ncbi:MAG: NAD(P)/FAD-dependent oxidoreductase [Actinomycetes bacterium]
MRVVVVGAGFAGLMAASDVRRFGHDVVVLEARNRVGGRVWSEELVEGDPRTVIERGAEFVLDGYLVMRETLADLGLDLADMGMSYYERRPVGGSPTSHAAMAEVARNFSRAAGSAAEHRSIADVVEGLGADPAASAAFLSRVSVTSGVDASRLAAWGAEEVTGAFEPKPSWRVAGGNQQLATGLARRLGDVVYLGCPALAIRHDAHQVVVSTETGVVTADAAIVCVPMAVLRTLDISPVPDRVREAWARAGIGHNAKLHVPLLTQTGAGAVQNVPERFWTWTAADGSGDVQPVLHAFGGTESALAELDVANGPKTWARRVAALRPELSVDLERAVLTTWNDDPWAGESYSATTLQVHREDDELVAQAFGRVHVAGEHTAGDWAGLMEGALRTGRRAAAEALAGYASS